MSKVTAQFAYDGAKYLLDLKKICKRALDPLSRMFVWALVLQKKRRDACLQWAIEWCLNVLFECLYCSCSKSINARWYGVDVTWHTPFLASWRVAKIELSCSMVDNEVAEETGLTSILLECASTKMRNIRPRNGPASSKCKQPQAVEAIPRIPEKWLVKDAQCTDVVHTVEQSFLNATLQNFEPNSSFWRTWKISQMKTSSCISRESDLSVHDGGILCRW